MAGLTVIIANTKGGVGKSTFATTLAELAAPQTGETLLVDMDPQGSAAGWAMAAEANSSAMSFKVEQLGLSEGAQTQKRLLELAQKSDVVVVDTPPGKPAISSFAAQTVAEIGGVVVVPTGVSLLDLPRTLAMVDSLVGVPTLVVLNRHRGEHLGVVKQARTLLTEANVQLAATSIRDLSIIANSGDSSPSNEVKAEFKPLLEEVAEIASHSSKVTV